VSEELCQPYRELAQGGEHLTLISDKGSSSAEAFEVLDNSPVPTQPEDLLKILLA
jgi:hypothetical protein